MEDIKCIIYPVLALAVYILLVVCEKIGKSKKIGKKKKDFSLIGGDALNNVKVSGGKAEERNK